MLSGIGPAEHLRSHGMKVITDLPGVGQELQDHRGPGSVSGWIKDPEAVYGNVPSSFDDAVAEFGFE